MPCKDTACPYILYLQSRRREQAEIVKSPTQNIIQTLEKKNNIKASIGGITELFRPGFSKTLVLV